MELCCRSWSYAVDRGATMLSGSMSFSSSGGDLFENVNCDKSTEISINPSLNTFVSPNFFVGGLLNFSSSSQGDFSSNSLGIGPRIGFAAGSSTSDAFPYISVAALLTNTKFDDGQSDAKLNGHAFSFSGGVIFEPIDHLEIDLSINYYTTSQKFEDDDTSFSGNTFSIGVGILGLFYQ